MASNNQDAALEAIAQHYLAGKYCDLRLVAKDGTAYNVHRVIVCTHSPVLAAMATDGITAVNLDDDATTLQQVIEWMYGIDRQKLLIDGKSVEEVTAMGPAIAYGEILALTDLATVAEKYGVPKLKEQATELLGLLVKSLTSLPCIIGAIRQLVPEGPVQTMATRALDLVYMQQEPSNDLTAFQANIGLQPHLQSDNNKHSLSPTISDPNPQKKRRVKANDPSRISTALPTNDPPQGPHCHCYASGSDQTLLECDGCGGLFHPRCVGKGKYAKRTYGGDPVGYMMKDKERFEDEPFKCGDCETGFFGRK